MDSGTSPLLRRLVSVLKRFVSFVIGPPGVDEDAKPVTLAIPEARSSFHAGDAGWTHRPPARIRCPNCDAGFVQERSVEYLRCPRCRFERDPDDMTPDMLVALECPFCGDDLETGIRHPNLFSLPQWASCEGCHYHWERTHDFRR